ncbi:MAG: DEAD/DEAH box helicase [Myxococcaceae bacterium]|nr:DEAD/DEAH box helicase [Myxococcaceae bacterium]
MTAPSSFKELGLSDAVCSVVASLGYTAPTPVQAAAIPPLLEGRDVLGLAATGTGKTAAFALPMVERLTPGANRAPGQVQGLVLAPTRELALQVSEAIKKYGSQRRLTVLTVYGGSDIVAQMKQLRRGVDVVVATPGRALDHIRRKTLDLSAVKLVVLDEADEMLDLGFAEDLEAILSELPEQRQTALFSATLAPRIAALGEHHLKDPVRVRLERGKDGSSSKPRIEQQGYVVAFPHKAVALKRVLELVQPESAIIFCRTREDVEGLGQTLERNGHSVASLHGGLSQEQRDRVMKRFKQKQVSLLVATDVAARGLDVDHVSHVVNVDLPHTVDTYVHRIGRTGRAGREGVAISFVLPKERHLVPRLEQATQGRIELKPVPSMETLAEHRLRQLESTVAGKLGGKRGLESARGVVAKLVESSSLEDVAAAALVALSEALHPPSEDDEVEIPAHGPGKGQKKPFAKDRPMRDVEAAPERARAPRAPPARHDEGTRSPRAAASHRGATSFTGGAPARADDADAGLHESSARSERPRASAPRSEAARASAPRAARASAPDVAARASAPRPPRAAAKDEAPRSSAPRRASALKPSSEPDTLDERPRGFKPDRRPASFFGDRASRIPAGGDARPQRRPPEAPARRSGAAMARLFFSIGKKAGIRPQDLVGAIANEAGIESKQIGAIAIGDRHSFVEVASDVADQVISTMRSSKIRGRPVHVDHDRSFSR